MKYESLSKRLSEAITEYNTLEKEARSLCRKICNIPDDVRNAYYQSLVIIKFKNKCPPHPSEVSTCECISHLPHIDDTLVKQYRALYKALELSIQYNLKEIYDIYKKSIEYLYKVRGRLRDRIESIKNEAEEEIKKIMTEICKEVSNND